MKKLLLLVIFPFIYYPSYSRSIHGVLLESLNSSEPLPQIVLGVESDYDAGTLESFVSSIPLIQYYKTELLSASLPAYYSIIPILESRNVRGAVSTAGAAGVWQLMPATAKDLGLSVEGHADQRFDIVLSTRAAVNFLRKLHIKYRDPILVLVAYNWGSGNLDKTLALHGNKPNFNMEQHIPLETSGYITQAKKYWNMLASSYSKDILAKYPDVPYFRIEKRSLCKSNDVNRAFGFLNNSNFHNVYCVIPNEVFYTFFREAVVPFKFPSVQRKGNDKCRSFEKEKFLIYHVQRGDTRGSIIEKLELSDTRQIAMLRKEDINEGQILLIPKLRYLNTFSKSCM